ncbi:MAG: ferrous iron transport protein B [Clostridiales bacterium]|nr:ferrous iron transport protein B [Clostridiales bacterium]
MSYTLALAGNPNCGKTTFFNAVTGSNQYVGNWPGVTVEKKEGKVTSKKDFDATIVDLPGIYSLSPYSMEEIVSRNFIIDEKPDLVIDIADATNFERNMYLALQIAELGKPMIIAMNMADMLEKEGSTIDYDLLTAMLGIKVVPISASKNININKLLHIIQHEILHAKDSGNTHYDKHLNIGTPPDIYTGKVRQAVLQIENIIREQCSLKDIPLRWSAVKLIEGDAPTLEALDLSDTQLECLENIVHELESDNIDREIIIADQKYKYICDLRDKVLKRGHKAGHMSKSDKIDLIVTNKFLAIPLFLLVMLGIFYITFGALGANLTTLIDNLINVRFADFLRNFMENSGAAPWATGLVCDGIVAGLGEILAFFPQIFLLFFFLSILEDSGYMARAAFIMDKALHSIGLSGKSFVPMLMGFGCTVPAIMSTKTLENEKDRRLTIMLTPFMSCSAKMSVYSLFIMAFFAKTRGLIVFSLYFAGLIIAIISAFIIQKTVLKGGHAPFVMELPPYRMPTAKTLGLHLWEKIKDFFSKAATVLLGASIVIWAAQYFSPSFHHIENSAESILGVIGAFIAPIFKPLGFGDWKSAVALLSGLIARESIVSALGILFGAGSDALNSLAGALQSAYTPLSAYSFMLFCLLFIPCIAAVSTIRREMNSIKWTAFTLAFQGIVAWLITFIFYQAGSFIIKFF